MPGGALAKVQFFRRDGRKTRSRVFATRENSCRPGASKIAGMRRTVGRVIVSILIATSPLLAGCPREDRQTPTPDTGAAQTCGDLQKMASDTLTATIASVDQCASKADCARLLPLNFSCLDCLQVTGGERLQAAIAAQAGSINRICDQFKGAGCTLIPSGCPGFVADPAVECIQGRCVLPSTTPASCHWPASLDATDAGAGRCVAKRHRLSCNGGDAGVFESCISDSADHCEGPSVVPGVTFTCRDDCQPSEYGVVCGGIGPGGPSSEPPSADCRSAAYTPGGTAFYCCPCVP